MRILAVRGRNLASLAGDFEVELADGPLGRVGLFAITGATGAGKSTLLDAVCLALFDKTPRFRERGGVHVGHRDQDESLRVRANDVRNLLRRGTGEGYAEVDFRATDGRRYRARWAVRRANKKPGGALQSQEMSLEDLETGRQLGGKKLETLAALEERLGLTFDQFRRSALLAQGDFAAFLKASRDERAELLEKMTGTDLYQRISQAAYERSREERRRVQEIEQRRADLGVLTADERAALDEALAEARHALDDAVTQTKLLEGQARWYAEGAELRARVEEASREVEASEAAWQEAGDRREELARMRAVEPLRAHVEGVDRAMERLRGAQGRVAETAERERVAREAEAKATEAREGATKAEAAARAAWEEARPALKQAHDLDRRLEEAGKALQERTEHLEARAGSAREAGERAAQVRARLEAHRAAEREAAGWLEEHRRVEPVARAWEACERELGRVEAALNARRVAETHAGQHEQILAEAEREEKAAHSGLDGAGKALAQAKEARDRAEAEVSPSAGAALREERQALEIERDRAARALAAAEAAAALAAERDEARRAAAGHREIAEKAREEAAEAEAETGRLGSVVEERDRTVRQAESARSLEEQRHELREGEPCPLCGANEHPWAGGTPLAGLLDDLRASAEEARRAHTAAVTRGKTAEERARQATERAEEKEGVAEERWQRLEEQATAWREARTEALPDEPTEDGALEAARTWRARVDGHLTDLADREAGLEHLRAEAERGRQAYEAAREARDQAKERTGRTQEIVRARRQDVETAQRDAKLAAGRVDDAMEALAPSLEGFPGWETAVATRPRDFRLERKREVEAWTERQKRLEEARAEAARVEPQVAEVAEQARQAAERRREAEEERRQAEEALATLREDRAGLLGGRPTEEVERELEGAAKRAEAERKAADEASSRAQEARAAAETARKEAAQLATTREEELAGERRALAERLEEHGLTEEAARERLARDRGAVEREAEALGALDQRRSTAETVLKERRDRQAEHEAEGRPEASREEVVATLEAARETHKAAQERFEDLRVGARQDDDRLQASAALAEELQTQAAVSERWGRLSALIGSADGKVFRNFAQGLTLQLLLEHANRQLDDLAPRYRLQQVPGHDLELQVLDREMGDEVRSIHSLSGGETFLASLSLALGLASMASTDTPVESLFIDEGFGTLDRETLEVALAALDALQASGRQVGLISHVEGLADHIGARVHVEKLGGGRSRVTVQGIAG